MESKYLEGGYKPKSVAKEIKENSTSFYDKSTQPYEKPLFQEQTTMDFPEKILMNLNKGRFSGALDLCSRCHHCR